MKKVMCPKCEEVFYIDENRDLLPSGCVYCKKCREPFLPSDGEKKLEIEFKNATNAAYKDMYSKQAYEQASGEYEYALTLKENDLGAIVGSIISKIYASKLNDRAFLNIVDTLEAHDIVLNAENTFVYLSFVRDTIYAFEQFLKMSFLNLAKDEIFYNHEYFEYYKDGIKEINEVLKYFKDSLTLVDEEEYKNFVKENALFLKDFETMENGIHNRLNRNYKVNEIGVIHLKDGVEEVLTSEKYEIETPSEVDLNLLPVNYKAIKIRKLMIAYFVFLSVLIATFIALYFVTKHQVFIYLSAIPILLALGGYFLFTYLIKKSY